MQTDRLHRFALRVYYEDTDFSGVVYHAGYLRFLERGRTELLRDLGVDQTELFAGREGSPRFALAVVRMEIDFRQPARMDDVLVVETRTLAIGRASLTLRQRLLRGDESLVESFVRIAGVTNGRAARFPPALARALPATLAFSAPTSLA